MVGSSGQGWQVVPGWAPNAVAWATYSAPFANAVRWQSNANQHQNCSCAQTKQGWGTISVRTNANYSDNIQAQGAGYLEGYISAAAEAVAEGAPLRGYFAWSLLDNFEWAWGYWKRFGLVYIDYPTLERVPKGSFYWYRDLIAAQRAQGRGSEAA